MEIGNFTDEYGTEEAYLLDLPMPICIDDGSGATLPSKRVHVAGSDKEQNSELRNQSPVGRRSTAELSPLTPGVTTLQWS